MYFFLTYSFFLISLSIFFKKKKIFVNYTGDKHQFFSNQKNIPLVGGIFLILPIILVNYQNIIYSILLILIFLLGFLSDQKILNSAKKIFVSNCPGFFFCDFIRFGNIFLKIIFF